MMKCHKYQPRDSAMGSKEEVVPFLRILKEGFEKEMTFEIDLEKTNKSSPVGE